MTGEPSDHAATDPVSPQWTHWRETIDLEEYHTRWKRMEEQGTSSHGEADFIEAFLETTRLETGVETGRGSVLDAGCGMGRVAIELARRGIDVEGADLDDDLLAYASADHPEITWHHVDLTDMQLPRSFDVVAMPGNVMIFCRVDHRAAIVSRLAAHLLVGGLLVAGFSLDHSADALTLAEYDDYCDAAGLTLRQRYSTWERAPYDGGNYAVSVHERRT